MVNFMSDSYSEMSGVIGTLSLAYYNTYFERAFLQVLPLEVYLVVKRERAFVWWLPDFEIS